MGTPIRHRMNKTLSLTTFTDEPHSSVGSAAFRLSDLNDGDPANKQGHDYFTQENLVIRTASEGGGTLLDESIDYVLTTENTFLSNLTGSTIYEYIQVINAAYQACDLYFSGKYVADDVTVDDINNITNIIYTITDDTTIPEQSGYRTYIVNADAKTITLPDATKNLNLELYFVIVGTYTATFDGYGSQTIDGNTSLKRSGNQNFSIKCDGSNWRSLGSEKYHSIYQLEHQQNSGTNGGASTAGSWLTLTINTEVITEIYGASLSSNQITLPAGQYYFESYANFVQVDEIRTRLYNITDSTEDLFSESQVKNNGTGEDGISIIKGPLTITSTKVFELQYRCGTAVANWGLGRAINYGTEKYITIIITKRA